MYFFLKNQPPLQDDPDGYVPVYMVVGVFVQ